MTTPYGDGFLDRIVNVHFGSTTEYLLLYVEGRAGNSDISSSAQKLGVQLTCPEIGWNSSVYDLPTTVDKVTAPPGSDFNPVPKFDAGRGLTHAFPATDDQRTRTTPQVFHFLDRGSYNLINRQTGEVISAASNGLGHVKVPFWIDWSGSGAGGFPPDLYVAPTGAGSLFTQNLALAIVIDCGIGGVDWDCNFLAELAGHDAVTAVTSTTWVGSRCIWINWSQLKSKMKAAKKTSINIKVRFVPNNSNIGGKASYYGYGFLSNYLVKDGFTSWPVKEPINLTQFMNLLQHDAAPVIGRTAWVDGTPTFFPPNAETHPSIDRFGLTGAVRNLSTGESKRGPGFFTFTATVATPADIITVSPAHFEF